MKTPSITAILLATSLTAAHAETWSWAPIRDGATLDAHLAQFASIRPSPLPIFETIAEITGDSPDPDMPGG